MKITPRQYAQSLVEILEGAPENQRERCLNNFVKILESNNDLKIFPLIAEEIKKISEMKSGLKEATITTAIEISEDLKTAVSKKLETIFNAKIKLNQATKPDILGGAIIEFDNEILDSSTRAWMNKFKQGLS